MLSTHIAEAVWATPPSEEHRSCHSLCLCPLLQYTTTTRGAMGTLGPKWYIHNIRSSCSRKQITQLSIYLWAPIHRLCDPEDGLVTSGEKQKYKKPVGPSCCYCCCGWVCCSLGCPMCCSLGCPMGLAAAVEECLCLAPVAGDVCCGNGAGKSVVCAAG